MSDIQEFKNTFNKIVTDILSELQLWITLPNTLSQFENILKYNVPHKSELRGYLVPLTYIELVGETIGEEEKHNAYLLGWAFQILQASMGMVDDYFDDGDFRYGQPSWFNVNHKSPINVNDGILLSEMAFKIVHNNFREHPAYTDIICFFSDMNYSYYLGQRLELEAVADSNDDNLDEKYFTMERYMLVVKLVNVGFMFPPPQKLALLLAGYRPTDTLWKEVHEIGSEFSYYWSVLDDFLDSFGKDLINPIVNEDIKKGKATWLIIKAKELCSSDQWRALMENYGKKDEDNVKIVKEIFQSLGIPDLCQTHLGEVKNKIENILTKRASEGKKVHTTFNFMLKALARLDE